MNITQLLTEYMNANTLPQSEWDDEDYSTTFWSSWVMNITQLLTEYMNANKLPQSEWDDEDYSTTPEWSLSMMKITDLLSDRVEW